MDIGERQRRLDRVKQPTIGAVQRIGGQRCAKHFRLKQQGEPRQRALVWRSGRQAAERRPDRILDFGRDQHPLMLDQCGDPLPCPAPLSVLVDPPQRLEGEAITLAATEPEYMMCPAHPEHRRASGIALVEQDDAGPRIAAELQGDQREQHRFAGPGRADHHHVADVADMGREPEGRRTRRLRGQQRRAIEMGVAGRPGPHARQRHEVSEVERMDKRLADIGIGLAGQRRQPRLDRVHALADGGEAKPVDDPLDGTNLVLNTGGVGVGHGDRRGEVTEGDMITAERLQRQIGIDHLVVGIAVEQLRWLVVHHLAQHRGDRLAFIEPLATKLRQRLGRVGLVEREEAGHPAIGEVLVIERVEDPRPAHVGETDHTQRAQVKITQLRLQAAGQRRVDEQSVEIERCLGHGDGVRARRDGGVEVDQCLG